MWETSRASCIHISSKQQESVRHSWRYRLAAIFIWVWRRCWLNIQLCPDHKCSCYFLHGCLYPGCRLFLSTRSLIFHFDTTQQLKSGAQCVLGLLCPTLSPSKLYIFAIPVFSLDKTLNKQSVLNKADKVFFFFFCDERLKHPSAESPTSLHTQSLCISCSHAHLRTCNNAPASAT